MTETEVEHYRSIEPGGSLPTLSEWRAGAIHVLLIAIAVIGLPAWGAVVVNAWHAAEMTPLIWAYAVVYGAVVVLALLPRLGYRWRIWGLLILGYVNGSASLLRLGLEGSGRLYLLLIPVFTTLLVGIRAGLTATFVTLATYAAFTSQAANRAAWTEAGLALAAFVLSTVVLLARFNQFQLRVVRREQRARRELETAQAQLEAYSATLEEKVQQRTAQLAEATRQAQEASQRFEKELLFAGRIQAGFMASELPEIPGWQQAAALIPARETSGDFYNVFPVSGGGYGVLIADVVDKGVGAALFMALCWALLHTYARRYPQEPARVLAAVNRRIFRDTHAGQFVTVFYGVLDAKTGQLTYANAGHPPPFRLRAGRLQLLSLTGMPLGILEDETWQERTVTFEPGDLCLLYTDGVTEAQNDKGDLFEVQRVAAALQGSEGRPAVEIRHALLQDLERFTGEVKQADDITLLVLTRRIEEAGSRVEAEEAASRLPTTDRLSARAISEEVRTLYHILGPPPPAT